LRIGVAWQGNPHHRLDRFRSVPLTAFEPVSELPNVALYSLQRGPGSEQLDTQAGRRLRVCELASRTVSTTDDWADTAAIIANLDLVISVDTAVAHLAGALGVPVWIALSAAPDWRWMLKRSDSPWYPQARLFRQSHLSHWEPVFVEMAGQLRTLPPRSLGKPLKGNFAETSIAAATLQ
jgi:hypothetical protein